LLSVIVGSLRRMKEYQTPVTLTLPNESQHRLDVCFDWIVHFLPQVLGGFHSIKLLPEEEIKFNVVAVIS